MRHGVDFQPLFVFMIPFRHWSMICFLNDLMYFIITPPLIHMNSIIKGDDAQIICGEIRIFDFDKMFFALKNEIQCDMMNTNIKSNKIREGSI